MLRRPPAGLGNYCSLVEAESGGRETTGVGKTAMVDLNADLFKVIVPGISAVVGGLIVVCGQYLIKRWSSNSRRKNRI